MYTATINTVSIVSPGVTIEEHNGVEVLKIINYKVLNQYWS